MFEVVISLTETVEQALEVEDADDVDDAEDWLEEDEIDDDVEDELLEAVDEAEMIEHCDNSFDNVVNGLWWSSKRSVFVTSFSCE